MNQLANLFKQFLYKYLYVKICKNTLHVHFGNVLTFYLPIPNATSFCCFQAQFEFALTAVAEEVNAILQALAK